MLAAYRPNFGSPPVTPPPEVRHNSNLTDLFSGLKTGSVSMDQTTNSASGL